MAGRLVCSCPDCCAVLRSDVCVGSWLRNRDGTTLTVVAPDLSVVRAADVGYVTGVIAADLDGDGVDEIIVGTQDGRISIRDPHLAEVSWFAAGDLSAG